MVAMLTKLIDLHPVFKFRTASNRYVERIYVHMF